MAFNLFFQLVLLFSIHLFDFASAVDTLRKLQSSYDVTTHNIRLDFYGSNNPFTRDVQNEMESIASDILSGNLDSEVALIDTTYAVSTQKPTLYIKIHARHPSYLSPSVKSFILLALRTNAVDLIEYLQASDEYNDISSVDVTSFGSFDNLNDIGNALAPTPSGVDSKPQSVSSGTKTLTIPLFLNIEDIITLNHDAMKDSIMAALSKILSTKLDKEIEFVSLSAFVENGADQLSIEIVIQHPSWMTSKHAKSLVMLAIEDNASDLYKDEALSGATVNINPTQASTSLREPASKPSSLASSVSVTTSKSPTLEPTHGPTEGTQSKSFPISLQFLGVSSDVKLGIKTMNKIRRIVTNLLDRYLDPGFELEEVSVEQATRAPRRRQTVQEWLVLNIQLALRYSIDHDVDENVSKYVLSLLRLNIDLNVLRDAGKELEGLEGIEVSTTPARYDMVEISVDIEPETTKWDFLEAMPMWAWILVGCAMGGVILIIPAMLCYLFFKGNKVQVHSVQVNDAQQQDKPENSNARRHTHRMRRSTVLSLPSLPPRPRVRSKRVKQHDKNSEGMHHSSSRQMNLASSMPPQHIAAHATPGKHRSISKKNLASSMPPQHVAPQPSSGNHRSSSNQNLTASMPPQHFASRPCPRKYRSSSSKNRNRATSLPPQKNPALQSPQESEHLKAHVQPRLLRRASSISDLPVSIYPRGTRKVPEKHRSAIVLVNSDNNDKCDP